MRQAYTRGFLMGIAAGSAAGVLGYKTLHGSNIHVEYQEPDNRKVSQILKYGMPHQSPDVHVYKNHIVRYDQERRIPRWVVENLSRRHVEGTANRKQSKFKPDAAIPMMFTSQNEDFWNSGWSRGHMAPAGDFKYDQEAMNETFLLTNIVPQDIANNAGFWNRLELYCRDLTKKFEAVSIFTGPLFVPQVVEVDGKTKKIMQYELLGKSEVAVPTHLFKVIVTEDKNKMPLVAAFVVPNKPIPNDHDLLNYQVPLEYVESRLGQTLLPKVKSSEVKNLCSATDCHLIPWDRFELYFIGRRLEGTTTLPKLEKTWNELKKKGIKPDEKVLEIYNRKQIELKNSVDVKSVADK